MGDVAKGIKSFKKGMSEDDEDAPSTAPRAATIESRPAASADVGEKQKIG